MKKMFGYARVSSKDQNLARQIDLLKKYGVDERDIITDEETGKNFNRNGYLLLKNQLLRSGDILVITELDRLGRSMSMIKDEWKYLENQGVNIVVLDMPILNTENKTDLERNLISSLVFELLSYVAEKERIKIKTRQAQGIQAYRDRNGGKGIGRPEKKIDKEELERELNLWSSGKQTAIETYKKLNISKTKFYKLVKSMNVEKVKNR